MPLTARRHVRKMRGGAQAHLLEADDGNFYVVKFVNNPQHRRILVNEMLASVFMRYLQISCPEFAIIQLTEDFVARTPEASMQLGSQAIPPAPGWHYGSRYPGDPDRLAVYDFVPETLLRDISNLNDFLGALVFDKWAANGDSRQAVFFRARLKDWTPGAGAHPLKLGFVAVMIDHGYLFNGPYWDFPDSPVQGLYYRKQVYEKVRSLDDFEPWLGQVVNFPEEIVDRAWRQIPPGWVEGEEDALECLLEQLLRRRRKVPELIRDCRRASRSPFPNWP
jgi:hypothetical protein